MNATPQELWQRLVSFLRFGSRDAELEEEMAAHLDMATEELMERGLSEAEARRQARLSFGSLESAKEEHRDSRGLPFLESFTRSMRLALRTLKRDAGLTTFAILIIGLGVGACTMVFSVANALLLRPLPFTEPDRLVWVANGESTNLSSQTVQVDNLLDLKERSQTLIEIEGFFAFYGAGDIRLGGASEPTRLTGVPVTEGFFDLLGVKFRLGRNFTRNEVGADNQVAILSHDLWQSHFSADPGVIGETISLDGTPATVVGVLASAFDFSATFTPGKRADLFTPYPLSDETNRQGNTLALIGRLQPGIHMDTAQAESITVAEQIRSENSDHNRNDFEPRIAALHGRVSGGYRQSLLILCGAVGLLMLIVCANLSNLLLAKAATRRREMAVHVALGAGRRQLVRQMLTESLLLSLGGAFLGLVLASVGTSVLAGIEGTNIPLLGDVRLDLAALGFTVLIATVTGIAFGLTPALQASASTPAQTLRENGRTSTEGRSGRWLRGSLVISEIALACVLLTGVGLLLRSFIAVLDVEMGFDTENVVALRVDPKSGLELAERIAYYDEVLRQVRAIPGVDAAGLTDALPLGDNFGWRTWDASAGNEDDVVFPLVRVVDDGYLETMRLGLKSGRFVEAGDTTNGELVIVINETLADRLWPASDPLGNAMHTSGRDYRVVGIVREARYFALERASGPEMYLPIRQMPHTNSVDLVVRSSGEPMALAPDLRTALNRVDPTLPTTNFRTMQQLVDQSIFSRRSMLFLLGGFAAFGLVLSSLGVYGVISYSVSQRRQEMGVRMAFGATGPDLRRRIVVQTLRPALTGIVLGSVAAWALSRGLGGVLYGVSASDPMTYLAVFILLMISATLASYLPARRTSRLDVVDALRAD